MLLASYTFIALQEHKFFEDAFKVYERGVQVFKYPHVRLIWSMYLDKFVGRYGGKKLERARDLFEQALKEVRFIVTCMHHNREYFCNFLSAYAHSMCFFWHSSQFLGTGCFKSTDLIV